MFKSLAALLLATMLVFSVLAQESTTEEAAPAAAEPEETDVVDLDNPEDADLDEQTYEEDDDDFITSEEIPADEPVPFPTNI